jgi:hypothetical protein
MAKKRLEKIIRLPYRDSSIKLIQTDDVNTWDYLLSKSEQLNIFMTSSYLYASEREFSIYLISHNDSYIGGFVDFLDVDSLRDGKVSDFSTYQSFFFCHDLSKSSASNLELEVMYAVTNLLVELRVNFDLSLHHSILDSRAFDWLNYDLGRKVVRFGDKYTGLIDLRNMSFDDYFYSLKSSRKAEFEKSRARLSLDVATENDIDSFTNLYAEMFAEKGIIVPPTKLQVIRRIILTSQLNGSGVLTLANDKESGDLVGGVLIQSDISTSYYHFACANQRGKSHNAPTLLMLNSIEDAINRGMTWFDVVGINSPKRGFYKSSFGTQPYRYIEVSNAE